MNRELYDLMVKIIKKVENIKSYIQETKQDNGITLDETQRIITRLENISKEADEELNHTLIRIEENFNIEQKKSKKQGKHKQ
ncbi:hypothetical protein A8F94_24560 [Bacillus sp. FJAT-27225]|uniref:hypothetical protein n=1 Tax=Bacillus sp. FJAT-27225 TaxID=1743144 RepID=UPI00080C2A9D|nr:hypothetical protein [Bacillus sp. FJAT-27225]OCA88435.1 hypothetical protein A8F94_24560 [Bacillus sp. FJAT-27225]